MPCTMRIILALCGLGACLPIAALAGEAPKPAEVDRAFLESLNALESTRLEGCFDGITVREAVKFAGEAAGVAIALSPEAEAVLAREEKACAEVLALRDRLRFTWERFEWKGVPVGQVLAELGRKYGFEAEVAPDVVEEASGAVPPPEYADLLVRMATRPVSLHLRSASLDEVAKALADASGVGVRVDAAFSERVRSIRRSFLVNRQGLWALLKTAGDQYGAQVNYEKNGFFFAGEESAGAPWLGPRGLWVWLVEEATTETALRKALESCSPRLALRFRKGRWSVDRRGGPTLPWLEPVPGVIEGQERQGSVLGALDAWLAPLDLAVGFAGGRPVVLPLERAGDPTPRRTVSYSLAFLAGTPEDYPGQFPEPGSRPPMEPPMLAEEREARTPLEMREEVFRFLGDFLEGVRASGPAWRGAPEDFEAELSGSAFRLRATPDVHEKAAKLLEALRLLSRRSVQTTFHFLEVDDALLRRLQASGRLSWEALGEEQVRMIEQGLEKGEARSVKRSSLLAFHGQTVSSSAVKQMTYVCDYDVEVAQAAQIGDPIVASVREGMVAEVLPVIVGGGERILLDVRTAVSKVQEPMESFSTPHGAVSLPRIDFQKISTSLVLRDGGSALIGGSGSLGVGKTLVLWLQAAVQRPEEAAPAPVVHHRQLRVFDILDLTHRVPDYPGPEVGLTVGEEDAGRPVYADGGDDPHAGERYDPDEVRDMVRSRIEPESWGDPANRLDFVLDKLVVVHRREVLGRVEALLDEMRARRGRGVEVTTRFLSIKASELAKVLEEGVKARGRAILAPALADKVLALVERDPSARLSTTVFPLFHKQRASLQTGRSIPYVRDIDVEVAQMAAIGDPVMGRMLEGTFLDYRTEMNDADDEVTLEIRPTLARLKKMTVADIGARGPGKGDKQAGEGKEKEGGEEAPAGFGIVGRVMLPELELQKIRATLTLRNGSTALLFCPSEAGADSDRDLVLMVTVRTAGAGGK